METKDTKVLIELEDRIVAEDIQSLLEEKGIYTVLESDDPASSILKIYTGSYPAANLTLKVNVLDYQKAIDILMESPYKELFENIAPQAPKGDL